MLKISQLFPAKIALQATPWNLTFASPWAVVRCLVTPYLPPLMENLVLSASVGDCLCVSLLQLSSVLGCINHRNSWVGAIICVLKLKSFHNCNSHDFHKSANAMLRTMVLSQYMFDRRNLSSWGFIRTESSALQDYRRAPNYFKTHLSHVLPMEGVIGHTYAMVGFDFTWSR